MDDYLERWNEESGDLDLPDRLDLMADEFFIDDSVENVALHEAAAEVRTLTAERDELVEALERVNVEGIQLSRVPDDGDPEVVVSIVKRSGERLQEVSREALAKLKEKP